MNNVLRSLNATLVSTNNKKDADYNIESPLAAKYENMSRYYKIHNNHNQYFLAIFLFRTLTLPLLQICENYYLLWQDAKSL
jgi:hypothetical protein